MLDERVTTIVNHFEGGDNGILDFEDRRGPDDSRCCLPARPNLRL